MSQVAEQPRGVHLATEPDFRLGSLEVSPSACRLHANGRDQRVPPRVMEVLVVLVRAGGRTVSRDELVEACWGGRFVSDDAISRVIAEVRNLARGVDPAPFVLETVPKVGYRLIRHEAEGPQTGPAPAAGAPSARAWPPRRIWPLIAGLAVLAVAAAGWTIWRLDVGQQHPSRRNGRVEVMRFEPLQADPGLQRLSAAVGDALVRMLATGGVQAVAGPVARDAGGSGEGAEIRIAGSVDRDGDKVVVNAQVLDRRSGLVLWSERQDRDAGAFTGFQEEAASRIADVLKCALTRRADSRQAIDAEVFALFLKACAALRADPPAMLEATRKLVSIAPRLSQAHSFHAVAQARVAERRGGSPQDVAELRAAARRSAARALELDPDNPVAYAALYLSYPPGADWQARERALDRAVELDPTHPVRNRYGELLREVGRMREARELSAGHPASDPLSAYTYGRLALMAAADGALPEAESFLRRAELLSPSAAKSTRLAITFWWEPLTVARRRVRELGAGERQKDMDCFDTYLGRLERAAGGVVRGLPETCDAIEPDWRVRMLARQGDIDGAYAELAQPLPVSRTHTIFLFYPEMKAFRADPRFMPLAQRLGLVDYWIESRRWPDFCAEPDLPYDCRAVARRLSASSDHNVP